MGANIFLVDKEEIFSGLDIIFSGFRYFFSGRYYFIYRNCADTLSAAPKSLRRGAIDMVVKHDEPTRDSGWAR